MCYSKARTETKKILIKYAKSFVKNGYFNWEKMGNDVRVIADKEIVDMQQTLKYKDALYGEQCDMKSEIRQKVEKEYDAYFEGAVPGWYDWVNGNENWRELLDLVKSGKKTSQIIQLI